MIKSALVISVALALGLAGGQGALAASVPANPMPEVTPEFLDKGKTIYFERCSFCHGMLGDGGGPAADFLDPRPRDFTLATYKFRSTVSGALPTDNDLFRTVSRGLQSTAMQAFDDAVIKSGLSEEERWQVIAYIKTFAMEFADPELDPVKNNQVIAIPTNLAKLTPEEIAKGKDLFLKAKCWECHGKLGRGDGASKEATFKKDDWGFPIRIRNLTQPWKIKAGSEVEDIFARLTTGITGTPMPSFVSAFPQDEDRWHIANYIASLQNQLTEQQVLRVTKVAGDIPDDPLDKVWEQAQPMDMRLAGQVVAAPRWQNPSIDMLTVKAIANDKDIAFQLVWDDPFKDTVHQKEAEFDPSPLRQVGNFSSYIRLAEDGAPDPEIARGLGIFRDSVALQFPVKVPPGTKKPHFLRGESSSQVQLIKWHADLDAEGKNGAVEMNARGWKQNPKPQAGDKQHTTAKADWDQGRWSLVMKRSLKTGDKNDVQFEAGKFIPLAVNAWDGSNGEHNLIMSLSTWYFLFIEAGVPMNVWVSPIVAFLLTGFVGFRLIRKAKDGSQGGQAT